MPRSLKIALFNEPDGPGLGGCELLVAVLAEELARNHQVTIVHTKANMTRDQLESSTGTDLNGVTLRAVRVPEFRNTDYRFPVSSYARSKGWGADLSSGYDLFIAFVHGIPPFCQATKGILVVLFPFPSPRHNALVVRPSGLLATIKNWLARCYYAWEWKRRLATYQKKVAISSFTAEWCKRRWHLECEIIHPPTNFSFKTEPKQTVILSVGRFTVSGHTKKQEAMLAAFHRISSQIPGWEYHCLGSLSGSPAEQEFYRRLQFSAKNSSAHIRANIERDQLKAEYQRAQIFWHAAGFDRDEALQPELAEHFGIVTVEAMAAGCVPVVADRGGQRDIVEHGVNGFLWSNLAELESYTLLLASEPVRRSEMAVAARKRATFFSKQNHIRKNLEILEPLFHQINLQEP